MLLSDCQKLIEAGETAKLVLHTRLHDVTVRIVAGANGFLWQRAPITIEGLMAEPALTAYWPDWPALVKGIEGIQTESCDWFTCKEPLEPYEKVRGL